MINKFLIGWYHAKYHRNLKKAEDAQKLKDINEFKKHVYQAEDAWKRVIVLTNKNKKK
jgi:hypothetical protein